MKSVTYAMALVLVIGSASVVGGGESGLSGDLARLQGCWVTRAGARRNIVVVLNVEGDRATVDVTTPQGLSFRASGGIRIDESTTPRALDWVGFTGLDSQDLPEIESIYEFEGETFPDLQRRSQQPAPFGVSARRRGPRRRPRLRAREDPGPADLLRVLTAFETRTARRGVTVSP